MGTCRTYMSASPSWGTSACPRAPADWGNQVAMRVRYVNLSLDTSGKKMQVSLEPEGDGPFEPGSTVTVTVRTRDNAGRPVAGELSLAVVDEAIYAIGGENDPGLFGNFWGERATNVSTPPASRRATIEWRRGETPRESRW